jgi:hypothetical protein
MIERTQERIFETTVKVTSTNQEVFNRLTAYLKMGFEVTPTSELMHNCERDVYFQFFSLEAKETVDEEVFLCLKFGPLDTYEFGDYEAARKKCNNPEEWQRAHDILKDCNATITEPYHPKGYVFSYWFGEPEKLYRRKRLRKG